MINTINTILASFTGPQICIILLISVILAVAIVLFKMNYTQQIRVAVYMDDECGIFNKDGLVQYVKGHKRKFKDPLFLAVNIENLATLYNTEIEDKKQVMISITDCLLQGLSPLETCGRCNGNTFVLALDGRDKDSIKKLCALFEERLLDLRIPSYGSYNFLLRFGVNDMVNLEDVAASVQQTISIFDFSNKRDGNIYYFADMVTTSMTKYKDINAAKDAALEQHQFQAYVQPKISLKTGKAVGGEVLCRWLNSQGEVMHYPSEFIPIFESNGFVKQIDMEMFEQTCQIVQNLNLRGYSDIVLSVNFSKVDFESKTFFDDIMNIMSKYNAKPSNIEIEITETTIMMNPTYINQCIMKLRNFGFHLAMDDFGQQYSSLGSLATSPFDTIKMDRVFFENNLSIDKEKIICKNVLEMLASLNINIVCEGVENEKVLEYIAGITEDVQIQGFVYSRPIAAGQFETVLATTYPHGFRKEEEIDEDEEVEEIPVKRSSKSTKPAREYSNEDLDELELLKMELFNMKKEIETERAKKAEAEKMERLKKLREELLSLSQEPETPEEDPVEAEIRQLQEEIQTMKNKKAEPISAPVAAEVAKEEPVEVEMPAEEPAEVEMPAEEPAEVETPAEEPAEAPAEKSDEARERMEKIRKRREELAKKKAAEGKASN